MCWRLALSWKYTYPPTDRNPTGLAQSTETFPIADISKEKWEKRENLGSQMTG